MEFEIHILKSKNKDKRIKTKKRAEISALLKII